MRRVAVAAACVGLAAVVPVLATTTGANASGVPLLVYSGQDYAAAEVAAFQKATGIPTQLNAANFGSDFAAIEAQRNNPQWGILWTDGASPYVELDQQGLLLRGFEPAGYTALGKSVIPADKSYVPTGFTTYNIWYNSSVIKNPPTTWQDLLSSKYKGKIGMFDLAQSGATYAFLSELGNELGGEAQLKTYLLKLKANGLHLYYNGASDELNALESGQVNVILLQSSNGIAAAETTPNIKGVYPKYVPELPSIIGIDGKAPAKVLAEAKKFATFVMSPAGQKIMRNSAPKGDSNYWPIVSNATPLSALPSLTSIPVQAWNPIKWASVEASFRKWFESTIA
jgi:iron(III) transport system substrate-binding protein